MDVVFETEVVAELTAVYHQLGAATCAASVLLLLLTGMAVCSMSLILAYSSISLEYAHYQCLCLEVLCC